MIQLIGSSKADSDKRPILSAENGLSETQSGSDNMDIMYELSIVFTE